MRTLRRWPGRLLWSAGLAVIAVLLLRAFAGDVYHVDSGSMEPTLRGSGEYVLVRYGSWRDLSRFDVAVVLQPSSTTPVVKRVVGLPGEAVQILDGDVLIDGERLSVAAPRPAPLPLFEQGRAPLEEFFVLEAGEDGPWSESGDVWELDATAVPFERNHGLMCCRRRIRDDRLDARGRPVHGEVPVNDLVLECEVRVSGAGGFLRFRLSEALDAYHLVLQPDARGRARASLHVRLARAGEVLLAESTVPLAPDAWHRVRFWNVDDHVVAELDGKVLLEAASPGTGLVDGVAPSARPGAEVCLGGSEIRAAFRRIRVLRDLYYTERGTFGTAGEIQLGPDEIFLLGDDSETSNDSRQWGPVRLEAVVGRPVGVIWPPARWRPVARPRPLLGP